MKAEVPVQSRVLRVLMLFERKPVWTVGDIAQELGVSMSSAYRTVQELSRTGFLDSISRAGYTLGPAFVQYDRLMRQNDALIRVASPLMRNLLKNTTQKASAVLCRRWRNCVMCVHQEQGTSLHPASTYERGVAMPIFAGATSKVILANLDDRALKKTYLVNEDRIRKRSGGDWQTFREQVREIRRSGYAVTAGEVAPGLVGIAAPIYQTGQVVGAVSLVLYEASYHSMARKLFPDRVMAITRRLSAALENEGDEPHGDTVLSVARAIPAHRRKSISMNLDRR